MDESVDAAENAGNACTDRTGAVVRAAHVACDGKESCLEAGLVTEMSENKIPVMSSGRTGSCVCKATMHHLCPDVPSFFFRPKNFRPGGYF